MSTSLIDIAEWIDRFGDDLIRAETGGTAASASGESGETVDSADSVEAIDATRWFAGPGDQRVTLPLRTALAFTSYELAARAVQANASVDADECEVALLH